MPPAPPHPPRVEDEEDVDDLDDVLAQFSAPPVQQPPLPAASSSAALPAASKSAGANPDELFGDAAFEEELAKGMESLMRDIAGAGVPEGGEMGEEDKEQQRKFMAAWEAMLVEGMDGAGEAPAPAAGKKEGQGAEGEDAFQATIRAAMEKMAESEEALKSTAASGSGSEAETLAQLLESLSKGGEGEGENEEEFQSMLESMMGQLMSKEVLYEPLKELHDKFPGYLSEHASTLTASDKDRYDKQYLVVKQIVAVFEDPTYQDDDPTKAMKVVELMNEMQSHGAPPAEIMGELPAGLDLGADGMPKLPENCTIA